MENLTPEQLAAIEGYVEGASVVREAMDALLVHIEELRASRARLRVVARYADMVAGKLSVSQEIEWLDEMDAALDALQPGDLEEA